MKLAHRPPFSPLIGTVSEDDVNFLKHQHKHFPLHWRKTSSFGNIVTTACANTAREEEEEEEAGWIHFCDGEKSAAPSRKRPEPKLPALPTAFGATAEIPPPGSTLQDKEALGVRTAVL